ncbi:MAG TPA: hypothetical protein VJ324_10600 [Candidatus Acidoferrum sp.]|jgi:hypothetical protein|nr:hypothetical protein [Candidatus Acidoferrum sp.]
MKTYLAGVAFVVFAFAGCGEPGRVRVSDRELVGKYVMEFGVAFAATGQGVAAVRAKEQLTLYQDKTYTQTFASATRNFTNHGTWKTSNELLGGTEIELAGASLSEDDLSDSQLRHGFLNLQVHREKGKLKLARNEAADSYYSRVE